MLLTASFDDVATRPMKAGEFEIPTSYRDAHAEAHARTRTPQDKRVAAPKMRLSQLRARGKPTLGGLGNGLQVRDTSIPPQDTSFGQTEDINVPQCLPATYTSQLGLDIEQQLLTDIQFIIDSVLRRLNRFDGNNGQIVVNWLDQWRNTPSVNNGEDGLFCLLLDSTNPAHPGFLLLLAERQARVALANMTLGALSIDAGLLFEITSTYAWPPEQRFDRLSAASRIKLRDLFLNERLGKFTLTYPTSSDATTIFFDLIGLSDIVFHVQLNDASQTFYDRAPIITKLQADKSVNGSGKTHAIVSLGVDLRDVTATATVAHWPSAVYGAAVVVNVFLAGILPALAQIGPSLTAATIFFALDIADVRVELENAKLDATIGMQLDKNGILEPVITDLSIDADVNAYYMSEIPDVVHQIVSMIYNFIGNEFEMH